VEPDLRLAASALRATFAIMFITQVGIASLTGLLIVSLSATQPGTPSALGPVLAALAIGQCFLGMWLPDRMGRSGDRGSALAATLLCAVLLSTPGWFLLLALLTGQAGVPVLVLALAVFGGYALGFLLTGRLAARVASGTAAAASTEPR
jgi:hypothetical protein